MSIIEDSDSPGDGRRGRTVLELPVTVTAQKKGKQRSPQENIDEFWRKFTTRTPGRGERTSLSVSLSCVALFFEVHITDRLDPHA